MRQTDAPYTKKACSGEVKKWISAADEGVHVYNENSPGYLIGEWEFTKTEHEYGKWDDDGWYVVWTFDFQYSIPVISKLEDAISFSVTARAWISLEFEEYGDGLVEDQANHGSGLGIEQPLCTLINCYKDI